MNLLMISGDRSLLQGKQGAFWYTLQELSKHWGRIDILCPHAEQSSLVLFGNVYLHASPWGLLQQPKWIFQKGKELIALHRHSVMTVHEYPPFYNGIGAKQLHVATGIPYALEIHHVVGHPRAASMLEWIGKVLSWIYLRFDTKAAKGVRTVSKGTATTLMRWGIEKQKISVVPSFYLDRALLAGSDDIPKPYDAVFCGRLVANKGLLETIRAIHVLEQANLLIIGDGPLRNKAEVLVKELKIAHRIEFRGWLGTQEEVVKALRSGKVFIMNSKSEGGPRVALEAMACGLPVIATKVGVMPDVIEDGINGVFTDGTPRDLAEKLSQLLADPDRRSRIGMAARGILDRFERQHLIAAYARYLQSLV